MLRVFKAPQNFVGNLRCISGVDLSQVSLLECMVGVACILHVVSRQQVIYQWEPVSPVWVSLTRQSLIVSALYVFISV